MALHCKYKAPNTPLIKKTNKLFTHRFFPPLVQQGCSVTCTILKAKHIVKGFRSSVLSTPEIQRWDFTHSFSNSSKLI